MSDEIASVQSLDDLAREIISEMLLDVADDRDPRERLFVGGDEQKKEGRPSVTAIRAEIAMYVELELAQGEKLENIKARLQRQRVTLDQIRRAMPLCKVAREYLAGISEIDREALQGGAHVFSPDIKTIADRMRKNSR